MCEQMEKIDKYFFIDETPLTPDDKKAVERDDINVDNDLVTLLNILSSMSVKTWVAIRTGDLLDTRDKYADAVSQDDDIDITPGWLKSYIQNRTKYKVSFLTKRVRNTGLLASSVPHNRDSSMQLQHNTSLSYNASVLETATSHTVPGEKPFAVLTDFDSRYR